MLLQSVTQRLGNGAFETMHQQLTICCRRHWILADIPGCDILRGKEISAYSPAEPDADTGLIDFIL